jgi:hypothetical protein
MIDSREILQVPRAAMDRLERGFFHLRFTASQVATQLDEGGDPHQVASLLREAADRALQALTQWREACCQAEHDPATRRTSVTPKNAAPRYNT